MRTNTAQAQRTATCARQVRNLTSTQPAMAAVPRFVAPTHRDLPDEAAANQVTTPLTQYVDRPLSASQRAMAAVALVERYAKNAKNRRRAAQSNTSARALRQTLRDSTPGRTREFLAKHANVSPRTIQDALFVTQHGVPSLIAAVNDGLVSVSVAKRVAAQSQEPQLRAVSGGKREIRRVAKEAAARKPAEKAAVPETKKDNQGATVELPPAHFEEEEL